MIFFSFSSVEEKDVGSLNPAEAFTEVPWGVVRNAELRGRAGDFFFRGNGNRNGIF